MDTEFIRGLMTDSMQLTVMIALPILMVALVVGLVISILQATTSIQEQTLAFIPKIIAVGMAYFAASPLISLNSIMRINLYFHYGSVIYTNWLHAPKTGNWFL